MGTLRCIASTPDWAVGTSGNVAVGIWRGTASVESIRFATEAISSVAESHRGRSVYLSIIEPASPAPNEEARKVAREHLRKVGKDLCAVACVIEGTSMRSTLGRLIMTGITAFSQTQETECFSRVADSLGWIEKKAGSIGPTLAADVEELRAAMGIRKTGS